MEQGRTTAINPSTTTRWPTAYTAISHTDHYQCLLRRSYTTHHFFTAVHSCFNFSSPFAPPFQPEPSPCNLHHSIANHFPSKPAAFNRPWQQQQQQQQQRSPPSSYSHYSLPPVPHPPHSSLSIANSTSPSVPLLPPPQRDGMAIGVPASAHHPGAPPPNPPTSFPSHNPPSYGQPFGGGMGRSVPDSVSTSTSPQMSGATLFNLSILTSDMWAVVIRIFFYKQQVDWLYYLAFTFVGIGLIIFSKGEKSNPVDSLEHGEDPNSQRGLLDDETAEFRDEALPAL